MRKFILFSLLLSFFFSNAQNACSNQIGFSGHNWTVIQGPMGNLCGQNGILRFSFNIDHNDFLPEPDTDLHIRVRFMEGVFGVAGMTGVTSSTVLSSGNNTFGWAVGCLTINHTGSGVQSSIPVTIDFNMHSELIGNIDDFLYSVYRNESGLPCFAIDATTPGITVCESIYYNNILPPDDFEWVDEVIPSNNQLSQINWMDQMWHRGLQIQESFIVDRDFSFIGNNTTGEGVIHMHDDATIRITNNSNLTMRNYSVVACDGRWNSIIVEGGSSLIIDNSSYEDARDAIILEPGAAIIIDNGSRFTDNFTAVTLNGGSASIRSTTFENNGIGLHIDGDVNMVSFRNNVFEGCDQGVRVSGGTGINLAATPGNPNVFDNCDFGIVVVRAGADIRNNEFRSNLVSIVVLNADFTNIQENSIGFEENSGTGIIAISSEFRVESNEVGTNGFTGPRAIVGVSNSNYGIVDNDIEATRIGISVRGSQGEIDMNRIGLSNPIPTGIDQLFSTDDISDNIINATDFAIRSNSSTNSSINNNLLEASDDGLFLMGGSTNQTLSQNIIEAGMSGIRMDNSGGNISECNEIAAENAIRIGFGSDIQEILGNNLSGSTNDILIESVLGVQEHNGNIFNGETIDATALSDDDVFDSRFIVDQDDDSLIPDDAMPQEIVELQDAENNTFNCDGMVGPGFHQFTNPIFMCWYIQRLEALKNANPKLYWSSMYRLMRHYSLRISYSNWPECVKTYWMQENTCGMKYLLEKEVKLKTELLQGSETSPEERVYAYEQQAAELQEFYCTNQMFNVWKEVYISVLKELSNNELTESEKNTLDTYARKCAYKFGDAVHWARSLMSAYNSVDYYVYDDCQYRTRGRSSEENDVLFDEAPTDQLTNEVLISPNPAHNEVTIYSEVSEIAQVFIYDATGRTVKSENVKALNTLQLNISDLKAGLYLIKTVDTTGQAITKKLIKR